MPALIPLAIMAGSAISGYLQNRGTEHAADATSNAANYAADLQKQSSDAALAFTQGQDARDREQAAQIQRANYDQWAAGTRNTYEQTVADATNARNAAVQGGHNTYNVWAAREGRMGQLGDILGLGPRYVPKYEELPPLQVPTLNIPPYSGPGGTGTQGTGQNFDPSYIGQQVTATLARYGIQPSGRGSGPGDVAYWVDQIRAHNGWEPYWNDRIGQEVGNAGLGHASGSATTQPLGYVAPASTLLH